MKKEIKIMATNNIRFDDATVIFKNFGGNETMYNAKGDRNFAIALTDDFAEVLKADGWNVRYTRAKKEGDTPRPYLPVRVKFHNNEDGSRRRNPNLFDVIYLNDYDENGNQKYKLRRFTEDTVDELDYSVIERADLVINGSSWERNGRSGIKAYLESGYFTLKDEKFDGRYADAVSIE